MLLHKGFSILWLFSGVQLSDSLILRVLSVIAFSYYYYYYCMDLHIHNNAIAGDWVTKKSPQISSKPFSILADSSDAVICKFENLSRILNFSRLVSVVIGCVPSALIIIGMTLNLIHLFCSQTSSWYFPNFSASFFFIFIQWASFSSIQLIQLSSRLDDTFGLVFTDLELIYS